MTAFNAPYETVGETNDAHICVCKSNANRLVKKALTEKGVRVLRREYGIYRALRSRLPKCQHGFIVAVNSPLLTSGMLLTRCGKDLFHWRSTFKKRQKKPLLTAQILVLLAHAVVCLETLHRAKVVHNDLKPENFCVADDYIGPLDLGFKLKLIDFGFATVAGVAKFETRVGMGTLDFCSANAMLPATHITNAWDDIESLVYTFIDIFNSTLAWNTSDSRDVFFMKRDRLSVEQICQHVPHCLAQILTVARQKRSPGPEHAQPVNIVDNVDYTWALRAIAHDLHMLQANANVDIPEHVFCTGPFKRLGSESRNHNKESGVVT